MSTTPKPGPRSVTTQDTAALTETPEPETKAAAKSKRRRLTVSEGTADDLRRLGKVTDPGTGYELRVGDDGKVTAHDRATGKPADVDVVCPTITRA